MYERLNSHPSRAKTSRPGPPSPANMCLTLPARSAQQALAWPGRQYNVVLIIQSCFPTTVLSVECHSMVNIYSLNQGIILISGFLFGELRLRGELDPVLGEEGAVGGELTSTLQGGQTNLTIQYNRICLYSYNSKITLILTR